MSFSDKRNAKHTDPITIPGARGRPRSASISSTSSGSTSPTTPSSSVGRISIPSPSTSPILSYFLSQSPTKSPSGNTFPFRKFGVAFEGAYLFIQLVFGSDLTCFIISTEEDGDKEPPVAVHARRASANIATRFTQPPSSFVAADTERANNLLRRLSLGVAKVVIHLPLQIQLPH